MVKIRKTTTSFNEDLEKTRTPEVVRVAQQILISVFNVKTFVQADLNDGSDDIIFQNREDRTVKVETKNYFSEKISPYTVCLEVHNDLKEKTAGWVFKLKQRKVDCVLFIWHRYATHLIVNANLLEDWWRQNWKNYRLIPNAISVKNGNSWQSSFCVVSIDDLPDNCIIEDKRPLQSTKLADFMEVHK